MRQAEGDRFTLGPWNVLGAEDRADPSAKQGLGSPVRQSQTREEQSAQQDSQSACQTVGGRKIDEGTKRAPRSDLGISIAHRSVGVWARDSRIAA